MKIPVKIWSMWSDEGYVTSSGSQAAIVLSAECIPAGALENPFALYALARDLEGDNVIQARDLLDAEPYYEHTGALNYQGESGTFEVPDGKIVVVYGYESICTSDEDECYAFVAGGATELANFYRERAKQYLKLAQQVEAQV